MARLRLATYNINGIRARLGALLEWLEREQPDIVCLQELKAPDEAFPVGDIEKAGYGALWQGQKSWNGVAVLSRGAQPQERRRGLPGDPGDTQSRYLEAEVLGLVVGCLYLPNGNPWPGPKFDYKLAWFERLLAHARRLLAGDAPVVLAGDFNVVPTDELDIYDPKSWRKDALLQPESREAWFGLLEQGWTDALRAVHGDARIYTFWDYFRRHWERDAGLRIDHILLDPRLAPMLADAGVDRWVRGRPGASDHAPTWVELDAGGARGRAPRGDRSAPRQVAAKGAGKPPAARSAKSTAAVKRAKAGDATGTARDAGVRGDTPATTKRPATRKRKARAAANASGTEGGEKSDTAPKPQRRAAGKGSGPKPVATGRARKTAARPPKKR